MFECLLFLSGFLLGFGLMYVTSHYRIGQIQELLAKTDVKYQTIVNVIAEWQKKI